MRGYGLILHARSGQQLTLESLAAEAGLHPRLVAQFVDYGLLTPLAENEEPLWFDASAVRRLRAICRLRRDLQINLPGIAVVLELLERIESLERELANLREH